MEIAKLRVTGNRCVPVYVKDITRGMIGATIQIEYTDTVWDDLIKTVVFLSGGVTKDVVTNEETVKVPAEVLETANQPLMVGVYGMDSDNNLAIPTLWADCGMVKPSADPSGDETSDTTLPVWAQILENAKISETNAKKSEEDAKVSEINAKASEKSAKASETSAISAKDAAERAANEAETIVGNAAWIDAEINESGHLILSQSDNFNGATFNINEEGNLEVTYQ